MTPAAPTLAIHPGALGDVLLAVPALRRLRAAGAGPLLLAAQPRLGALLVALGVVDRALDFEGLGLARFFTDDDVAAPAAIAEAARVVCWFGARDPDFARRLRAVAPGAVIAAPAAPPLVWRHLLGSVAGEAAGAGAADVDPALRAPVVPSAALLTAGRALLAGSGWDGRAPVVVVHPGAGGAAKRWPAEGFAAVLTDVCAGRRADLFVAVHEGPADGEAVAALRARLAWPRPVLAAPPLPALAGALALATLWLGNDSGIAHLAAAVGTPAIVLFRAEHLAWRPWSASAGALTVTMDRLEPADRRAVAAAAAVRLGDAGRAG